MVISGFIVDERRLQLLLLWILVTWNAASAAVASATLCVESSFTNESGLILAQSYPEPAACQCTVFGKSKLRIEFYDGSIQSDSCHEQLILQDPNQNIIFDSCQETDRLKNRTLLKEFSLEDRAHSLVTFKKYVDPVKAQNGKFSLYLVSSSELRVDCSDDTGATIPPPLSTQTSGINWISVVTAVGGVVLLALAIALTVFFVRKYCATAEQPKSKKSLPLSSLQSELRRPEERNQNDYSALPESAMANRVYDEITMNGLASTQQTAAPGAERTDETEQEGPISSGGAATDQLQPSEREDPGLEHGSSSLTTDTSEEALHEAAGVEDNQIGMQADPSHLYSSVNKTNKKKQTVETDDDKNVGLGNTLTDMVENANYRSFRH